LTADEQAFLAKGVAAATAAPTATSEPTADAATAVRKLQSGQALTDAEKKLLGISVTTTAAPASAPVALKTYSCRIARIIAKLLVAKN
jgi:hypothetical protein